LAASVITVVVTAGRMQIQMFLTIKTLMCIQMQLTKLNDRQEKTDLLISILVSVVASQQHIKSLVI
jgi:uncharacterized membrane protein